MPTGTVRSSLQAAQALGEEALLGARDRLVRAQRRLLALEDNLASLDRVVEKLVPLRLTAKDAQSFAEMRRILLESLELARQHLAGCEAAYHGLYQQVEVTKALGRFVAADDDGADLGRPGPLARA